MIHNITAGAAGACFVFTTLALGVAIAQSDWTAVAVLPVAVLFAGRFLVCALVPGVAMDTRVATQDCMPTRAERV